MAPLGHHRAARISRARSFTTVTGSALTLLLSQYLVLGA